MRTSSWSNRIGWPLFVGWLLIVTLSLVARIHANGPLPVDYEAYERAVEATRQGSNLYPSAEAARQTWLDIHQYQTDVLAGRVRVGERRIVGPYVYLPTLAIWMSRLQLDITVFLLLMSFSVYGFCRLWLGANVAASRWLLLVVGSEDVWLSLAGGNVEPFLLFLSLFGAWLLWRRQSVFAAIAIATTILIKPFYGYFFLAFGLLKVSLAETEKRARVLKPLALAATAVVAFIALDVFNWGPGLRSQASTYLSDAMAYQWFVLPVDQQTPMSLWNRTLFQGLVNAGWSPRIAQVASLGTGTLMIGATMFRIWEGPLPFAPVYGMAFVIFYWIRPVGWGLPYLEVVMIVTLWPILKGSLARISLLSLFIGLTISHWLALLFTSREYGLRLLTLQGSGFTWETWLILPICWLLLLWATPRFRETR